MIFTRDNAVALKRVHMICGRFLGSAELKKPVSDVTEEEAADAYTESLSKQLDGITAMIYAEALEQAEKPEFEWNSIQCRLVKLITASLLLQIGFATPRAKELIEGMKRYGGQHTEESLNFVLRESKYVAEAIFEESFFEDVKAVMLKLTEGEGA